MMTARNVVKTVDSEQHVSASKKDNKYHNLGGISYWKPETVPHWFN